MTPQLNESRNESLIRNTNRKYYETDNPYMRRTACISQAGQPQVSHRPWREAQKQKKKKSRDLAKVLVLLETCLDFRS